jgi:glutathione S-transferase
MEVPRMLLAIGGKFPGDYVDGRYEGPTGNLVQNLGRMPVLEVGENSIGQSAAINYYLATELGLMGSNTLEAAQIISVAEHLKEMMTTWRGLCAYGVEPTTEVLDKWFTAGATDSTGPADRAGYSTRFATWWAGRIETALGGNGFAVGNKLSLADVLLYNVFAEFLVDEQAGEMPQWKREAFGSKARTDALVAQHPKIQASINAVAANENVQKWLATRGVQGF